MLTLVDADAQKAHLQKRFSTIFKREFKYQGKLKIGHPGDTTIQSIFSNGSGSLWCCFAKPSDDVSIPRYWNAFGIFDRNYRNQNITVELNVPSDSNSQQVAAFFAREQGSNCFYLMHSGKIGGGGKGVGKNKFLAWCNYKPVMVTDRKGNQREGIVIAELQERSLVAGVSKFVTDVAEFKKLAKSGRLQSKKFRDKLVEFEQFHPEFTGRKKGSRARVFDYVCHHGAIANALYKWRSLKKRQNEKVINSIFVDLKVMQNQKMIEAYEVKPSVGRQAIYSAVGQLLVHAGHKKSIRKTLVLPKGEEVPSDIVEALRSLGIQVLRFTIGRDGECLFDQRASRP